MPANLEGFIKLVNGLKTETPFDVMVLRKGTSKKISGVILLPESVRVQMMSHPKSKTRKMDRWLTWRHQRRPKKRTLTLRARQAFDSVIKDLTISRNGDITTVKDEKNETKLTISCVVKNDAVFVGSVEVNDGGTTTTYKNILAVPEAHRARVQEIVDALSASRAVAEKK